jgi:ATP-binding cassette, subfamily C (CFTR/MRP), member 1
MFYANSVEQEAPAIVDDYRPDASWPRQGKLDGNKLVMSYRQGLPPVLKGLDLHVNGGEKIGVVGR